MTLGDKQRLFTRLVAELISWAYSQGYEMSLGEARRTDEQAEINAIGADGRAALVQSLLYHWPVLAAKIRNNVGSGIRNSLHEVSLAIDLNLFKDGVYLMTTEQWKQVGEKWESMHELARWGGRFSDANHVSLEHEGRK